MGRFISVCEVSVDEKTLVSHTRSDEIRVVLGRAPGATVGFEACGVSCDLGDARSEAVLRPLGPSAGSTVSHRVRGSDFAEIYVP